ncbi:MAG TPA: AAA family ATPase, partial [Candidatus Acidoferrales bacterium]|nr:AAA family ATPase [Candidatus Acidoferrales bacterium]
MRRGRILVLNGTSSSGKTTLASALQSASPEPYEVVGLDRWLKRVPPELFVVVDSADHPPVDGFLVPMREGIQIALPTLGPAAIEVLKEMYVSFAAGADRGTNLIVDDVLWHPAALALAISQFADRDAWLIGVLCPISLA